MAATAAPPGQTCPRCSAATAPGARFCGACGVPLPLEPAPAEAMPPVPDRPRRAWGWLAAALVLLAAALALALLSYLDRTRPSELRSLRAEVASLSRQTSILSDQNRALARRLGRVEKHPAATVGVTALAARVLRSVFTIDTPEGLGSGWAAWTVGGDTYLITANHVVTDTVAAGSRTVKVEQKNRTWTGQIVRQDDTNDLATIRVHGLIAPALWQHPQLGLLPSPGDELVLVGSPYGLEGTVTTGIVSRVTYDAIQTDAAANPGNSGGPAVDQQGDVVGVLLSGGGENLNFAVPIQRACVTLRHC